MTDNTLQTQINEDLKQALKQGDKERLQVLRNVSSEFTNEMVKQGTKEEGVIDDESAQEVIARLAKQRKDSIEQFKKGDREDLAEQEQAELEILQEYLPEQLSEAEIEAVVEEKMEATGAADKSDMGQLMGVVMSELKGQADGNDVRDIVEKKLS